MLVVESDQPVVKRIQSGPLLSKMNTLKKDCADYDYCMKPCPRETTHRPKDPVAAPLNHEASGKVEDGKDRLAIYSGRTRSAKPRKAPVEPRG
jgi:hypothetical protein